MPEIPGITEPCPACTPARELLRELSSTLYHAGQRYRSGAPVLVGRRAGEPLLRVTDAALDCPTCRNQGHVLTDAGQVLAETLRAHLAPVAGREAFDG